MTTSGKLPEPKQYSTSLSDCLTEISRALAAGEIPADTFGTAVISKLLARTLNSGSIRETLSSKEATAIALMSEDKEMLQALLTASNEALLAGSAMLILNGWGHTTRPRIMHVPDWRNCGTSTLPKFGD